MTVAQGTWLREASYVPGADGVELAAYVFRPSGGGAPCPVIWTHNLYNRPTKCGDNLRKWVERFPEFASEMTELQEEAADAPELPDHLLELVTHGYALAIVDVRGSGSSYGTREAPFSHDESLDARHVTSWLASRPWCNGRVGMFGRSYMGANQHTAAATRPPELRAILPEMAPFDVYSAVHSGGIFRHDFARSWFDDVRRRDSDDPSTAVDADAGGARMAEARAGHRGNRDLYEMFSRLPFRDSVDEPTGSRPYLDNNPGYDRDGVRQPGVPTYHVAGWYDPFVRDSLLWFENVDCPKRITIGPWAHSGSAGIDLAEVYRTWFDLWLREGDEAAPDPDDAPVRYYTIGAPPGERWRAAESWPPPGFDPVSFALAAGPSGSCASVNDGVLAEGDAADGGSDEYVVDYSTSSGSATRWTNTYGGPFGYPDMSANDARALTYTTAPLAEDRELTGHPILRLLVEASADDLDVFAYLEQVSADGSSTYVTEGALRASHRARHTAPYASPGLPYHGSIEADCEPLGGGPVELELDLFPTSWLFPRGSRIRLAIAGADRDNALTPVLEPAPTVTLHRGPASRLVLPLSRASAGR
jgi:hypothetical protein